LRKTRIIGRRGQGRADLCYDDVWLTMDVRGRETQEAKAGVDEQVLPAVVFNEALAVIAPVIFESESRRRVIEVCPTDELLAAVAEVSLNVRVWQTCLDQQPSKSCLHRRFGRSSKRGKRPEAS
jgi:hypothetical protein